MPGRRLSISEVYRPHALPDMLPKLGSFDEAIRGNISSVTPSEVDTFINFVRETDSSHPRASLVRLFRIYSRFESSFDTPSSVKLLSTINEICRENNLRFESGPIKKLCLKLAEDAFAKSRGRTLGLCDLASIVSSLSELGYRYVPIFYKAADYIRSFDSVSADNVIKIATAFSDSGFRPAVLFTHLSRALLDKVDTLSFDKLGELLGAFGRANYSNDKLINKLIDRFMDLSGTLSPQSRIKQETFPDICLGFAVHDIDLAREVWKEAVDKFERFSIGDIKPEVVRKMHLIGLAVGAEIRDYMPSTSLAELKRSVKNSPIDSSDGVEEALNKLANFHSLKFEKQAVESPCVVDYKIVLKDGDKEVKVALHVWNDDNRVITNPESMKSTYSGISRMESRALKSMGYVNIGIYGQVWRNAEPHQRINLIQEKLDDIMNKASSTNVLKEPENSDKQNIKGTA